MTNGYQRWERRSAHRHAKAGKLWWLGERDENFSTGWTADTSRSGVAFVTAAADRIHPGETVSVSTTDPRKNFTDCETLRVCRIAPYGPALALVACARLR